MSTEGHEPEKIETTEQTGAPSEPTVTAPAEAAVEVAASAASTITEAHEPEKTAEPASAPSVTAPSEAAVELAPSAPTPAASEAPAAPSEPIQT